MPRAISRWPIALSIALAAGVFGVIAWRYTAPRAIVETATPAPPVVVSSLAATVCAGSNSHAPRGSAAVAPPRFTDTWFVAHGAARWR